MFTRTRNYEITVKKERDVGVRVLGCSLSVNIQAVVNLSVTEHPPKKVNGRMEEAEEGNIDWEYEGVCLTFSLGDCFEWHSTDKDVFEQHFEIEPEDLVEE